MRQARALFAGILIAGLAGGGILYAQEAPAPAPEPEAEGEDLPDVVAPSDVEANLTPREMVTEGDRMIGEMKGMLDRVLELQDAARTSKDVIKLNCVNENLLASKKLVNIAEESAVELREAVAVGDKAASLHEYVKIRSSHEAGTVSRDSAEGCIGDEIIFIGPTQVSTEGPVIDDDPTDDDDDWFTGATVDLEPAAYATPNGADL